MLKKITAINFIIFLGLITVKVSIAQSSPQFLWAVSAGGFGTDAGVDIISDNEGNIYTTGYYETSAQFGDTTLVTETRNIFITKSDSFGNYIWIRSILAFGSVEAAAITLDNSGNVIIAGNFTGRFQVESGAELNTFGGYDVCLIKYSANGDFIWLRQYGDTNDNFVNDITSHGFNNIYITGYNRFPQVFENQIFVAAFNTTGNIQWQRMMNGRSFYDQGTGIVVNNLDNIFITGAFGDTVTFTGTNSSTIDSVVIANGASDMFLAKYLLNGSLLWVKNINQPFYDEGGKISSDINGNVIFSGLTSIGNGIDVYLAKYSDDGNQVWEAFDRFLPYNNNVRSDVDEAGNVSVIFQSSLGENSQGSGGIYFSRFNSKGIKLWSTSFGSTLNDYPGDVDVDLNGDILFNGYYADVGVFGDTTLLSQQGTNDIFITKVISPKISFNPASLNFGNVLAGERIHNQLFIENNTGTLLYISDALIFEPGGEVNFNLLSTIPDSILPNNSVNTDIEFAPLNEGLKSGYLIVESDAPTSPDTLSLSGTGVLPSLIFSDDSLDFGNVLITDSSNLSLTLSNLTLIDIIIEEVQIDNDEFEIVNTPLPDTLLPDDNKIFTIKFKPVIPGLRTGSLIITSTSGSSPDTIILSGTGIIPPLTYSDDILEFGTVDVNNFSDLTLTITNSNQTDVTIDSISFLSIDPDEFTLVNPPLFPAVIPSNGFINFNVRFAPLIAGLKSGSLTINSNTLGSPKIIVLTGDAVESIIVDLPDSTVAGQSTIINANSPGPTFTLNQFFYKRTGENVFQQSQLLLNGETYSGQVPPEFSTMRGIQFYIVFNDTIEGSVVTYPSVDPINNPASIQVRVPFMEFPNTLSANKYQMVSIPMVLSDSSPSAVLEDDFGLYNNRIWRFLRWDPSTESYSEFESLNENFEPQNSFWLINRSGQSFDIENALSVPSNNSYTITLLPGWNQIANPFAFPIDWSLIGNAGLLAQAPARWNPETEEYEYDQLVLNPWEGYWVYDSLPQPINILVPPVESIGELEKNIYKNFSNNSFVVQIKSSVELTDYKDNQNFVGMDVNALEEYDKLDIIEAPPVKADIRLSVVSGNKLYARNIKPYSLEGTFWNLKLTSVFKNKNINLRFDEKISLPENFNIWLIDLQTKHSIPLINNSSVVNMGEYAERKLRLIIGSEEYAKNVSENISLLPDEYQLYQNFPNPFNPETNIYFTLKENSIVTLEIYDILGRRVKSLISNEQMNAGLQNIKWNGADQSGNKVASGIYIYRIKANNFSSSKKMMLIK